MSRAFVKELDGEQADADVIERPQSEYPNYMTMPGLAGMKQALEDLRAEYRDLKSREEDLSAKNRLKIMAADMRYLEKRIQCAIPVDVSALTATEIRFGATVKLLDENDQRYQFTIVGEDESDANRGRISWISPLARELIGKKSGDTLIWKKPSGDLELEVTGFSYI